LATPQRTGFGTRETIAADPDPVTPVYRGS
jgi:hypothetical protein